MARIEYEGTEFEGREGETVLDTLLRHGRNPPFSCRNGACLVCMQRCTRGGVPERAQRALRPALRKLGYFLPCRCVPTGDMALAPPRPADMFSPVVVVGKELLAHDVCRLTLEPATSLYYHAGQFVNLRRADGVARSYSLASVPHLDASLEVHVRRIPGGAMSGWIFDELRVDDELELQGPNGRCFYVEGSQEQDLVLVAGGTGLAPLIGIVRDALASGHRARIVLVHGTRDREGLYLHDVVTRLSREHANLRYVPCVAEGELPSGCARGRAADVVRALGLVLAGARVYTAGSPAMVRDVETWAVRSGLPSTSIHTDPFDTRAQAPVLGPSSQRRADDAVQVAVGTSSAHAKADPASGDADLWAAVGRENGLREILHDFYTRVFEDAVLAPYFRGVTMDRLVGQVFGFMRDILTGERLYFGLRPRTAHHWMVISDEIFDHREQLMERVLRDHGLPEQMLSRWRRIEESFRDDIVKSRPWPLVVNGVTMPLDGFGVETLSVGTICDGCHEAIEAGERARYHLRLGLTYCARCTAGGQAGSTTGG